VAGMGGSGIVNGAFTIVAVCIPMEKRAGTTNSSFLLDRLLMNYYLQST
jgi:hypothetical protein